MNFTVGCPIVVTEGDWIGSEGTIISSDRAFLQVDAQGNFMADGIIILESEIANLSFPSQFDGNTLIIEYPKVQVENYQQEAAQEKYRYWQNAYTVKLEDLHFNVIIYQSQLRQKED